MALALASEPSKVMRSTQTRAGTLRAQDRAFLEASCGALDPRLASGTDGINVLSVCDTARLASETRREEKVNCP